MNQPTTPNTENCRLRLCCRNDAHATDCTTYHPSSEGLVNPPSRAEPASQHSDGWPGEIYLQAGDEPLGQFGEYDEVSWCDHPQGQSDVRYVRADEASGFREGRNAQPEQPASPTVAGSVDTPEIQAIMFEVYEYASVRDGIHSSEGDARVQKRDAMVLQANKIRTMLARLAPAAPSGEAYGWVINTPDRCDFERGPNNPWEHGMGAFPVYTHPAPSSPTAQGLPAQAVPEGWREALLEMQHKLNSARIWGGMGWKYNPLHYLHYKPALDKINLLLAHQDTAQVAANKQEGK